MNGELDELREKLSKDPKIVQAIDDLKKLVNEIANSNDPKDVAEKLRKVANDLDEDETIIEKYPDLEEFVKITETALRFIATQLDKGAIKLEQLSILVQVFTKQLDTVTSDINE